MCPLHGVPELPNVIGYEHFRRAGTSNKLEGSGTVDYNHDSMTAREQEFKTTIERNLPEYAKMCQDPNDEVVVFHQDAFAADYQTEEMALLGLGIKYAGLMGKEVHVIGHNRE